ncbi:hypothetical protein NEF87_000766 [Candidatus Lokiarchaeum ossiferum]|uniref:Pyridoxamine 5'-phosphate oxidase putative domain-containing protein n=1 Tax=Candidatus Lokiarchaeum ossiferum TaxID=2951803 RepID=A0ABY6HM38_9ARCH|nr:hypothetical protein NEF87_000766 [Candidatus Lokiarchaeum sp. B-35]
MENTKNIKEKIANLYADQRFGVFATVWKNQSHQTLVCFQVSEDLSTIIFGTPKNSRKFVNSRVHEKVSFFVDSANNDPKDLSQAMTLSAVGRAFIGDLLPKEKLDSLIQRFLKKHPYLEKFITSPSTDLVIIEIDHYQVVEDFQTVIDWKPSPSEKPILYRQIKGNSVVKGLFRGKIATIASEKDLEQHLEDNAIFLQNEALIEQIIKYKFKGVICESDVSSKLLEEFCSNQKIPFVSNLNNLSQSIEDKDEITIDGYLGLIIIHKIR